MVYGYLGAATYSSEAKARSALAKAQAVVDRLENEVRVLKSRKASNSAVARVMARLQKATSERDQISAQVKRFDARGDSALEDVKDYEKKAEQEGKKLQLLLLDEVRTKKSRHKEIGTILALVRGDRDRARQAQFEADKARYGVAKALENRIERYTRAAKAARARETSYKKIRGLSKETQRLMVNHIQENNEFYRSNIKLDKQELATIKRTAKVQQVTGVKQGVATSSPAALPKFEPNLLRSTKRTITLQPGATLPSSAELQQLYQTVAASVPKKKGESDVGYQMRVRRYTYRAAVRLANLRHKYATQKRRFTYNQLVKASVRETVVTDSTALEQEHKSNVFAPAGESAAVAAVDAATGVKAAPVSPTAFVASTPTKAGGSYSVPVSPTKVPASKVSPTKIESPSAMTASDTEDVDLDEEDEKKPAESKKAEEAPSEKEEGKDEAEAEVVPLWKKPIFWLAVGAVGYLGYKSMSGGQAKTETENE